MLTAEFGGVLAVVSGGTNGIEGRSPVHVLTMALAFVGFVVGVERRFDGRSRSATAVASPSPPGGSR